MLEKLYNVPTRVVERQQSPTSHPQAHFINLRTMEVLYASMPGFHDRLLEQAAPSAMVRVRIRIWRDYIYCTGVGKAREIARIDQFGPCIPREATDPIATGDSLRTALAALSPTQFLHFPQNRFETLLDEFLTENNVRIERGVELQDLKLPVKGNTLEHASFDYVVGADGAHSLVRQLCGVEMAGTRNLQSIANVHFTSKALSDAARENPAMLYFVVICTTCRGSDLFSKCADAMLCSSLCCLEQFNQDVIGILIAHDLKRGEWVFQIPFFPPQESIPWDFSVDQCKQIVRHILPKQMLTPGAVDDVDILSVGQWSMGARVAKQYDAGEQRVFLVGDAAHQFPPAGGFGMNTGLQDTHNLVWKLALAVQTTAENAASDPDRESGLDVSTLLRSYGRERQRIAKLNTQFSLRNVARTMKIPRALNVSHDNAQTLAKLVNSAPMQLLPLSAQRALAQRVMRLGKMPLGLLDEAKEAGGPGSALGNHMRASVQDIVTRRSSLGMMFYHFDIGFSYDTPIWEARAKQLMQDPALDQAVQFCTEINNEYEAIYAPAFRVGERFPHFWCSDSEAAKVSTLDLTRLATQNASSDAGNVQFLLVVSGRDAAQVLRACASSSSSSVTGKHVTLVVMRSKSDGDAAEVDAAITAAQSSSTFNSVLSWQVVEDAADKASNNAWASFMSSKAAALVRPDGHVGALWTPHELENLTNDALTQSLQHAVQLS
ncbi:hypothetical protein BBJ28_00011838 [Nothophytophthora sp. Chile5]|nr:hypothetical protein BBJ28_00011838 [Nothophytophthora sp. Chile5]